MYIDSDLVFALPAVDRERSRIGLQIYALHLAIAAKRTHEEPVLHCQQYISFTSELQVFSTPSPKDNTVTETKNFIKGQHLRRCRGAGLSAFCQPGARYLT